MLSEAGKLRMDAAFRSANKSFDHAEEEYPICLSILIQSADDAMIALLPVNCELRSHDLPEVEFDRLGLRGFRCFLKPIPGKSQRA